MCTVASAKHGAFIPTVWTTEYGAYDMPFVPAATDTNYPTIVNSLLATIIATLRIAIEATIGPAIPPAICSAEYPAITSARPVPIPPTYKRAIKTTQFATIPYPVFTAVMVPCIATIRAAIKLS